MEVVLYHRDMCQFNISSQSRGRRAPRSAARIAEAINVFLLRATAVIPVQDARRQCCATAKRSEALDVTCTSVATAAKTTVVVPATAAERPTPQKGY